MSYAVLWVPQLSLHALRRVEAGLSQAPFAIIEGDGKKAVVVEVSPEASPVETGYSVTLAMARCPGIILRKREPAADAEAHHLLLAAAFSWSPRVEATDATSCTIDLQGAELRKTETAMRRSVLELSMLGLPARAGAGRTPLLASLAAQTAEPVHMVTNEKDFLRGLPIEFVQPSRRQLEILRDWGLKTLGAFTALPKAEIGERMGTEGVQLWERAAGQTVRVLKLTSLPQVFEAAWIYEPPVETLEPLQFKLLRYSERVALELRGSGFVAESLSLALMLEGGQEYRRDFRLPEPGTDVASWQRVLAAHLETMPALSTRLAGAQLRAIPARPQVKQDGLFETGLKDPHVFWENLGRMAAVVGADQVGTPQAEDTHRPDAFSLVRPSETVPALEPQPLHPLRGYALRRFRPAFPVYVTLNREAPAEIRGELSGTISNVAGPWRSDGEWWKPGGWSMEVWQVQIEERIYQLARDEDGWWLEGELD